MEREMREMRFSDVDLDESDDATVIGETDHRIRNLLTVIEAVIKQTQSTNVEDYRAQLMTRIAALRRLRLIQGRSGTDSVKIGDLIERALRPYCVSGGRVIASGPDLLLPSELAFALHLAFEELALNAMKYGSLSCPDGEVEVQWKIRRVPGASRKLAVVWTENGGPEVQPPRSRGFGSRLLKRAVEGYGAVRLDFNKTGLTCLMLINLDRGETLRDGAPQTVAKFAPMPNTFTR
jgi:two-component sensor histidine kinase